MATCREGYLWKLSDPPLRVFQRRYIVADTTRALLCYWHSAEAASGSATKFKSINVFSLDCITLQEGPHVARASVPLSGTVCIELRKGHSGYRAYTFAAQTSDELHQWRQSILALSQLARSVPTRHLVEQVSALCLAALGPARQGWLWDSPAGCGR